MAKKKMKDYLTSFILLLAFEISLGNGVLRYKKCGERQLRQHNCKKGTCYRHSKKICPPPIFFGAIIESARNTAGIYAAGQFKVER